MGAESSKESIVFNEKQTVVDDYLTEAMTTMHLSQQEANLSPRALAHFSDHFWQDPKNKLAMNALMANDPAQVLVNPQTNIDNQHVFNVKLDLEGSATNQKSSGRCWLFAGTNVLRLAVIRKYKLADDFELSQNYLFFYDKLEKANWFLENMIDLADKEIDDRVVQYLLTDPVGDGGQWQMFINLIEKYGVVPKSVFPETVASSSTSRLNWLVTVKLREFAVQIRKVVAEGMAVNTVRAMKQKMMQDIYRIMVIHLGEPPQTFEWQVNNKNGKCISLPQMTPKQFMKKVVDYPIADTMSLIHDPRNPYNQVYTVARLGNIVGGADIKYVNTEIETIKKLAIDVLKSGHPVWFGCDVGQFSNRNVGYMDTKAFDYTLAFNVDFNMTKAQRLLYGESAMTHAMVFTGVHLKDNQPVRWRVENSWSELSGEKGFWIMTDAWFNEFVYQVVLEKPAVPKRLVDLLDKDPVVLPAYDPMGALA